MSLPPIVTVTSAVSAVRRSNCGGFGPGETSCGAVMSSVVAPLQLASRNSGYRSWRWTSWPYEFEDFRQPSGGSGSGISGPAA